MEQLGDKAEKIVPLFITFDPERDTLLILKDYASNFHPSILGLTGTPAETNVAAKNFQAFFEKKNQIIMIQGIILQSYIRILCDWSKGQYYNLIIQIRNNTGSNVCCFSKDFVVVAPLTPALYAPKFSLWI